ncbi:RNA polymerase sigma factor [Paenibacillus sp. GCM10028914]|uniref:RNA polymerase sigma factor n=1 Tax=Paenibacillus sp. GCM10028914 TaxID=3273416 RepID=UPI0036155F18
MTNSSQPYNKEPDYLLDHLNALLHRYCLSLTQSVWDSDDLVQDTWVKILEKMDAWQHNNPEALLLRTAKNAWIDQVRRRKIFERILDKELEQVRVEQEVVGVEDTINLEMAFLYLIKHLSPLQRIILLMRSVLGYSVAETAVRLHTTEGAVKAAYHRARKSLQNTEQEVDELNYDPHEEEMKIRIHALAAAYVGGNVEEVLRLVQENQEDQEIVSAVGAYSDQPRCGISSFGYSVTHTGIRMAA